MVCDGALYDVADLETHWGDAAGMAGLDFHHRVFAAGAAGLVELHNRLRLGDRPTEARVQQADALPLPPCDTERCAYIQIAPAALNVGGPKFQQRDSRGMVGDDQPVPFPSAASEARLDVGLACLLGEELRDATDAEAQRAIFGYTLVFDWTCRDARWSELWLGLDAPSQLGPHIIPARAAMSLASRPLVIEVDGARHEAGRLPKAVDAVGDLRLASCLAYISRGVPLRPGDVIGMGALWSQTVDFGQRVSAQIEGIATLTGRPVRSP